jgi:hypothetical protein
VTFKDSPVGGVAVICAVRQHCGNRAIDLVEQRANQGSVALVSELGGQDVAAVGIDGEVQPAPAATRLTAVLLMQPLPKIFRPLESITTFTGPFGFFRAVVSDRRALRRDKVVWSGTGRSRPSIWMIERSIPSVCRQGLPTARRSITAVSMTMSE